MLSLSSSTSGLTASPTPPDRHSRSHGERANLSPFSCKEGASANIEEGKGKSGGYFLSDAAFLKIILAIAYSR